MTDHTDVVVIGAGIVGASCAYELASRGLAVTVLERENAPALGSTGRSAAGVRVQFTTRPNIEFSMYSLPVYRSFRERHGFEVGYRDIGYLLLVPPTAGRTTWPPSRSSTVSAPRSTSSPRTKRCATSPSPPTASPAPPTAPGTA